MKITLAKIFGKIFGKRKKKKSTPPPKNPEMDSHKNLRTIAEFRNNGLKINL